MANKIEDIKNRVFGKSQEWNFIDVWDSLMKEYGFFPLEYFLQMDQAIINELIDRINKRKEKEEKQINKMKRGSKK